MRSSQSKTVFRNRQHAAHLLARKLSHYINTHCQVVSASAGGSKLGYYLGKELHTSIEVVLCGEIDHPGERFKTIGSISANVISTHDVPRDLPQDFIAHKIRILQNKRKRQNAEIYESSPAPNFENEIVLLTDDWVSSSDELLSTIHFIKRQKPSKIVVAVPAISARSAGEVAQEVDELIFLYLIEDETSPHELYEMYPDVTIPEIRQYIQNKTFE